MASVHSIVEPAPPGDLEALAADWLRSLRAENKSRNTVEAYSAAVGYITRERSGQPKLDQHGEPVWCGLIGYLRATGGPMVVLDLTKEHTQGFVQHLLDTKSPATAANRFRALRRFFDFLVDETEIPTNPMEKQKQPQVPDPVTDVLTEPQLKKLFAACEGATFDDRRAMAMFRLMAATGCRSNELTGMKVEDVDRDRLTAMVLGKFDRYRAVPFTPKAAQALDRYMRMRARHTQASSPWLWLGLRGKVTNAGLRQFLAARSLAAGLGRVHPHQLRHTFAHLWLAQGKTEGDLMRLAGWRSREMISRYGASAADERAHDSYRAHGMGDVL